MMLAFARRDILSLAAAALAAMALPAGAQPSRRMAVVALVLGTAPAAGMVGADPSIGFVHGLRDLGWIEGRTLQLERHTAEGDAGKAQRIFAELAARRVDVIAIGSEGWLQDAARRATRDIPLVANLRLDPVAAGMIDSFARPGGNLTGVTEAVDAPSFDAKRLQLLREIAPCLRRIAFLANAASIRQFLATPHAASAEILPAEFETLDGLETALAAVTAAGSDGLIVGGSGPGFFGVRRIAAFAAERRLPAIYGFREAIEAGGLLTYGASAGGRFRQMAKLVARFRDGAKVGDVPVEQPAAFELAINLKAARQLGLEVPALLLAKADEVIE
jgi:putative tryptophan/tyrosine transport system substrate-binding protein